MKKYFFTGLVIFLPVVLTLIIVGFLFDLLTNPFAHTVSSIFDHYGLFNQPFLLMSGKQVLLFVSRIFALVALIFFIYFIGVLGRLFLIKYIGRIGEYIIHRIPLVNNIYKSIHEIVNTILGTPEGEGTTSNFSRVVLVPFPHSRTYSIGLITRGDLQVDSDEDFKKNISVFVPGTPNPAMGFMLIFPREKIIPIEATVEEALKFVVSIGVICPAFTTATIPSQQDISAI